MSKFLIPDNFVKRNDLKLETKVYPLDILDGRVHDAPVSSLPTTSANDDLGITAGTFGTNAPSLRTSDLKAAGATTRYARFTYALPPEYVAGQSVVLRLAAGMITTVADNSATVDANVYLMDRDSGEGSDLCSTSATTMNSLTTSDKDFTITATSLSPGDVLDVRIAVAVNDGGTGTAVIAAIHAVEFVLGVRG